MQLLLNGSRIFRLPSNAELNQDYESAVYRTKSFPSWRLCQNFQSHQDFSVLYLGHRCPICNLGTNQEAIRFVAACPLGHLDDVNWSYLVHRGRMSCNQNRWFMWIREGPSLSSIRIRCRKCGSEINLGWAYRQPWRCSGRFPEKEMLRTQPIRPGCDSNARIIQRQASNLRISEIRTLFSISNIYTPTILHNLLQLSPIYYTLEAIGVPTTIQELEKLLRNLMSRGHMSHAQIEEILSYEWAELEKAINDVLLISQSNPTFIDLLYEEFLGLIDASINGAPPVRGPIPSSSVIFEVNPNEVKRFQGPRGNVFRITPVARLRNVTVQLGYRRAVGQISSGLQQTVLVTASMRDNLNPDDSWYPGVEFYGEGIFIMLDDNDGWHFSLQGDNYKLWQEAYEDPSIYEKAEFAFRVKNNYDELNPIFIWWHTLSHLLIRSISIEAGYPSPSIRERIFFENDNGRLRGGVILYATQPGSQGTLGGMIALVPHFDQILNTALDMLGSCSSDPLCSENVLQPGRYNGASCYACTLLSETSCEHRNLWLDRNVLLENIP